ncbi:hypothetical protein M378DRAFT_174511 [Amanita muscaria Koide BX008]|uniref:Uncharacterized protein n=1 Tax=Amanita muscaria (strain Koide BX008) TaxID=946122 RepID=A0A0C2SJ50_AMAMK|nr:hypothetical protein M378DRAFT_174511 [Amanita muscaria Koide BX008]
MTNQVASIPIAAIGFSRVALRHWISRKPIQLWVLGNQQNKTVHPHAQIPKIFFLARDFLQAPPSH